MDFELSHRAIGCAMRVHRTLGCGFLEQVYVNALAIELHQSGLLFQNEAKFIVHYRGHIIGKYYADFVIEKTLLLEIKALKSLDGACESQLLNYLNASGIHTGLLINFGSESLQFKRMTNA